jgi:hypothetical protein
MVTCPVHTTSGLAFKMHGRVGDSPIIGADFMSIINMGLPYAPA